jgi:hypothetical protein
LVAVVALLSALVVARSLLFVSFFFLTFWEWIELLAGALAAATVPLPAEQEEHTPSSL